MTHTLLSGPDSPDRLAAARKTSLLDTSPEEAFDRLTRLAARLLGSPVALVSLLAEDHEFFKSATGLPEPWASRRTIPLAYSFSRHVIDSGESLALEDARRHPLVRSSPAVRELGWIAYAGVPLVTGDGEVVGALSVADGMPRLWSERDLALLEDLAASVVTEVELRILRSERPAEQPSRNGGAPTLSLAASGHAMALTTADGRWLEVSPALCDLLGFTASELTGERAVVPIHPEDRAADREAIGLLLAGECGAYAAERRLVNKEGETVWVLANVSRVAGTEGRSSRFLAGFHDITHRKQAETELRESERRYRVAINATHDAVWDWDLGTDRVVWIVSSATFGYTDSTTGSTASWWYERLHPEDRERVLDGLLAASVAKARTWEGEYRFRNANGSYTFVRDRCSIIYDESGTPVRMIGAVSDVGHRRRSDQLAAGQSRLLEQIATGIEVDRILERIVRFTEEHGDRLRASVMLLEPGGSELRLAAAPSLPEDFRAAVARIPLGAAVCGQAAERRELVAVRDVATDLGVEPWREVTLGAGLQACWSVPILSSGGAVLGAFTIYYPEPREPAAGDLAIVAIATHLAGIAIEQARNLEALQRTTRLLQEVLDALPIGVWVLGQDGKIVSCNPAGREIWGGARYEGPDHFGDYRAWWPDTGQPVKPEEWAAYRAFHKGQTSLNELLNIEGFDGSKKMILNSAVPLLEPSGEVRGAIVLNQDVTERQAAADALRKSEEELQHARKIEAVGQLAGGIAHDFNNLLTGILSYCDLILEEVRQGDPIRADVEQIRHASQRAAGLTRQLLAFSRRQVLQPRVLSLNATVVELDAMLRRLLGADIALETELDPGLWYVLADPNQLEQVLVNLTVNARDAMPGGGRLTITTSNRKMEAAAAGRANGVRAGDYVILTVSDNGVGMDLPTQARIFEPFFTTKEQGKGTGLGLSSVYGIVEQSGGFVSVESAPGQGATFTIHLPRYQGNGAAVTARPDRRHLPGGSETLLLVEDEAAVRASSRRLLERHGYTVLEARHGAEALRIVEENGRRVDLVLTDLVMPEMGGRELVERLRARQPGLKVLYMSGYTEKAIAVDGTMPPHTGFVEKPFTVEQLMRRLRRILDQ
jgi:PAS domain S-box-containing protein